MQNKVKLGFVAVCVAQVVLTYGMETKYRIAEVVERKAVVAQEVIEGLDVHDNVKINITWPGEQSIKINLRALMQSAVLTAAHEGDKGATEIPIIAEIAESYSWNQVKLFFDLLTLVSDKKEQELREKLQSQSVCDLFALYKIAFCYDAKVMVKEAVQTLPEALVKLAKRDGAQSVKKFLNGMFIEGGKHVEKHFKELLLEKYPWSRYLCGEPNVKRNLDILDYARTQHIPPTNIQGVRLYPKHCDNIAKMALITYDGIRFPWSDDETLRLPDGLQAASCTKDGRHLAAITDSMGWPSQNFYLLTHYNGYWQHVAIDADHSIRNEFVYSLHWVSPDELVTIDRSEIARNIARNWKLVDGQLKHTKICDLPSDMYVYSVLWHPHEPCFFAREMTEPYNHKPMVVTYQQGAWKRTYIESDDIPGKKIFWSANGTLLYGYDSTGKSLVICRQNVDGVWLQEKHEIAVSLPEDYHCEGRTLFLSPDGSTLFIYGYEQDRKILVLRLIDGIWQLRKTLYFGSQYNPMILHANGPGTGVPPEMMWNQEGNKLLVHSTRCDVHTFNFDYCEKLSCAELLMAIVRQESEPLREKAAAPANSLIQKHPKKTFFALGVAAATAAIVLVKALYKK